LQEASTGGCPAAATTGREGRMGDAAAAASPAERGGLESERVCSGARGGVAF